MTLVDMADVTQVFAAVKQSSLSLILPIRKGLGLQRSHRFATS